MAACKADRQSRACAGKQGEREARSSRLSPTYGATDTSGQACFDGRHLLRMSDREHGAVPGRAVGLIAQNPMTALDLLLRIRPQMTDVLRMHFGMDPDAAHVRAIELLHDSQAREPGRVPHPFLHGLSQRHAPVRADHVAPAGPRCGLDRPGLPRGRSSHLMLQSSRHLAGTGGHTPRSSAFGPSNVSQLCRP